VVVFGKIAETLVNYLAKGKQVFVEGKINNRSYEDKEGNKKYVTEIVATNITLLGGKSENSGESAEHANAIEDAVLDDEIPF